MYHVFDTWEVNVVINNELSLERTLAFVASPGAVASFWEYSFLCLVIIQGQGWPLGQPNSW